MRIHPHGIPGNGLRTREFTLRHRGHGAVYIAIRVRDVVDRRVVVDDCRVVNIRYRCLVDRRV